MNDIEKFPRHQLPKACHVPKIRYMILWGYIMQYASLIAVNYTIVVNIYDYCNIYVHWSYSLKFKPSRTTHTCTGELILVYHNGNVENLTIQVFLYIMIW